MYKKLSKIYPGWWLVLGTGLIGFLGHGFTTMAFSVMFKPIAAELELGRAVTSIASGIQNGVMAVIAPLGGMASDKYGPRRIMLIGIVIASLGCFMMYFIDSLWAFLLVWGVLVGSGTCLGVGFITDRAIVNWFVKKSGMAINIKFAIQSMAGIVLLPLIAWLITSHGWRIVYIIAGVVLLLVCIPLAWTSVRTHRPEHYGLLPDGEPPVRPTEAAGGRMAEKTLDNELPEFTLKQTIMTPAYWIYISIGCLHMISMSMMNVHLIPFLTDQGIDLVQAASMMGMMTTISIPTRLVLGFAIDRIKTTNLRFLLGGNLVMQLVGISAFLIFRNTFSIYLWLILYGIGVGTTQCSMLSLLVRFFGRKSYGTILGASIAIQVPFGILSPICAGWVFDSTSSYLSFIFVMAILTVGVGVASFFIFPPKPPPRIAETAGFKS